MPHHQHSLTSLRERAYAVTCGALPSGAAGAARIAAASRAWRRRRSRRASLAVRPEHPPPFNMQTPIPNSVLSTMEARSQREYKSRQGSYERTKSKGKSQGYAEVAWNHEQQITTGSLGIMCSSICPFEQKCYMGLTPNNLLRAHCSVYGTKVTRAQFKGEWKYTCEKTFPDVKQARLSLLADARCGRLRAEQDWDEAGMDDCVLKDSQTSESAAEAVTWWMMWLQMEDQMPNEAAIQHRVVVWDTVYELEYKTDMEWFGNCAPLSRSRFLYLRTQGLKELSVEYYGADEKGEPNVMLSLVERAAHSNFACCVKCAAGKKRWFEFRTAVRGSKTYSQADARLVKEEIFVHIREVKEERAAGMKLSQEAFSRLGWTYTVDDACGSDYMYMPQNPGREAADDAKRYKYRFAMQCNLFPGHLLRLSLILPCVVKGGNFGCTAHFSSLVRMHELGLLGKTQVRQTDSGPDNDCATTHAYHWSFIHFGVLNKFIWFRLPPKHSHNKADRFNAMVKEKMAPKRGIGGGCLSPWDFERVMQDAIKSQSGRKEMAWHCANIKWDHWFKTFDCIHSDVCCLPV